MALTQEQKDFYCENGYLAYEQVLTSEELDLLRVEYDSEFQKAQETNAFRNLALVDDSVATVIEIKAGCCMFHHCQTLHHTPPNCTEHPRRAMVTHYMIPGTRGASGEILRVSLANPLLRMSIM
ncbi:MAG: phytanoyl-CoA dioxygenase family protein [Armatimonadetes bacterium]|nr:phytanoyl-CoA dioxygenase family protein [Armatimonadota bacterium]